MWNGNSTNSEIELLVDDETVYTTKLVGYDGTLQTSSTGLFHILIVMILLLME